MSKKQLLDILKRGHPVLADILKHTQRLKVLNARLPLLLNETLLPHTQIATLQGTTLTLMADSGLFATRLRYESQNIIRKCKTIPELCGVNQIEIKVQPLKNEPRPEVYKPVITAERKVWLNSLIDDLRHQESDAKK